MQHDIFISYSRTDIIVMQRVRDTLRDADFTVWTDEGIEPGTPSWKVAIEDAIEGAGAMVVLFSPDASDSKWVRNELDFAEAQGKPIYPLMVRGDAASAVPFGYTAYQWIDIRDETTFDEGMERLERVLRGESSVVPGSHPQITVADDEPTFASAVGSRVDSDGVEATSAVKVSGFGQITALVPIIGAVILIGAIVVLLLTPDPVTAPENTPQAAATATSADSASINDEADVIEVVIPEDWKAIRGEEMRVLVPQNWLVSPPNNDALMASTVSILFGDALFDDMMQFMQNYEDEIAAGQLTGDNAIFLLGLRRTYSLPISAEFVFDTGMTEVGEAIGAGITVETRRRMMAGDTEFLLSRLSMNLPDVDNPLYMDIFNTVSADRQTAYSLMFIRPNGVAGETTQLIQQIVSSFELRESAED